MDAEKIRELVALMDTTKTSDADKAWYELRSLGEAVVPYLLEAYPRTKKWQGRVSLVYHAMRYARASQSAYELGIAALNDKATLVRYRACMLLACSLRDDAIPHLKRLYNHPDRKTADDARAAVDAIRCANRNYFLDRDHTGNISISFSGETDFAPAVMQPPGSLNDPLADYVLPSSHASKPPVDSPIASTKATPDIPVQRELRTTESQNVIQRLVRWITFRD